MTFTEETDILRNYKVISNLNYAWNTVALFFWKRYPNPHAKHVLSEDILERKILSDGSMYTKRLTTKEQIKSLPRWIRYFIHRPKECVLEESIISPKQQSINTLTWNIGELKKYATFYESCQYLSNEINCNTVINKQVWIESHWNSRFKSPLISFLLYRYKSSSVKSTKGYEYIIKKNLNDEAEVSLNQKVILQNRNSSQSSSIKGPLANQRL